MQCIDMLSVYIQIVIVVSVVLSFMHHAVYYYADGARTLSIKTFSITAISIRGSFVTLNINISQKNNTLPLC